MKKKLCAFISIICILAMLAGCTGTTGNDGGTVSPEPTQTQKDESKQNTQETTPTVAPTAVPTEVPVIDDGGNSGQNSGIVIDIQDRQQSNVETLTFNDDLTWAFDCENDMRTADTDVRMVAPEGAVIYYTLDGSTPDENSEVYSDTLSFVAHGGDFPKAYTIKAKALLADGRWTNTAGRNLLIGTKLDNRFSTIVFAVCGDPDELINEPDGIFYGKNYEQRGRESEREVFVDAWNADGTALFSQFAGVRIYGGYSRQSVIKSMKLYARKSYDPDHGSFKFSNFSTEKLDGSDEIIKKYDRIVLRNFGNDNQQCFIRDELSQRLVKDAGMECYENVIPAVAYLNGSYYGFYWLHESFCDEYFQQKFGKAEGEFIVAEGMDTKKDADDDPEVQKYIAEYNSAYDKFSKLDLTNDANYNALNSIIDVEDYLTFFAWNITINNWDWPNNNFKCYRYVEAPASVLNAEGAKVTPDRYNFDGRWRFLYHDMDWTYGLYGSEKAQASCNTLKEVLNPNDERYSPLFAQLMKRPESREFFRTKTMEFIDGAFSADNIKAAYKELNEFRYDELLYFYDFMENETRKGVEDLWAREYNLASNEQQIFDFAENRGTYVVKYMNELLPSLMN